MAGKAEHLMPFTGSYQEQSGVGNDLSQTWGSLTTYKYRIEENELRKNRWSRRQGMDLTEMAINKELNPEQTYRFWKQGADTADETLARIPEVIRPVYDRDGNFAWTVLVF